jgi:hypothetical protein
MGCCMGHDTRDLGLVRLCFNTQEEKSIINSLEKKREQKKWRKSGEIIQ